MPRRQPQYTIGMIIWPTFSTRGRHYEPSILLKRSLHPISLASGYVFADPIYAVNHEASHASADGRNVLPGSPLMSKEALDVDLWVQGYRQVAFLRAGAVARRYEQDRGCC